MMFRSLILAAFCVGTASASEADIFAAISSGASTDDTWDASVAAAMIKTYDTNGSGSIESKGELKAISCSVFQAIDKGVQDGWGGTGLRVIYGFKKDFIWVGHAVGFDEKLRKQADKAMAKCKLG